MSIVKKWHSLDRYNRFLISYPFWFLLLFGLFYWGKYWSLSPIGEYLDHLQRDFIMMVLNTLLDNKIVNYDIIINPRYHVVITPECNGFVPYFIFLAGILAYPCSIKNKIFWAILGYVIFTFVNLLRLYIVTEAVNKWGADIFFYIHDIGGNLLLIITGAALFFKYLNSCRLTY